MSPRTPRHILAPDATLIPTSATTPASAATPAPTPDVPTPDRRTPLAPDRRTPPTPERRTPPTPAPHANTDVVVVGSGPNGLAAAVVLARAGLSVVVLEAESTLGGGARTLDLGLAPGITHDLCAAVHPLAIASSFFREFDLRARGVNLITPDVSYGQPLGGGRAALAHRDLGRAAAELGEDGPAWERFFRPLLAAPDAITELALGDKRSIPDLRARLTSDPGDAAGSPDSSAADSPATSAATSRAAGAASAMPHARHALRSWVTGAGAAAAFTTRVAVQGTPLWNLPWRTEDAKALLTGVATHAIGRQPSPTTAGTGLLLAALAHADGWPIPVGGSQAITEALLADFRAHGGEVHASTWVRTFADLPPSRVVLFDTTAEAAAAILGDSLPSRVARGLRGLGHGPGAAKVDLVLDGPIPWGDGSARADAAGAGFGGADAATGAGAEGGADAAAGAGTSGAGFGRADAAGGASDLGGLGLGDAGTVHVGGTRAEMAEAEAQVVAGRMPGKPVVLISDPGRFDASRIENGLRPVWAYAHVPADCPIDPTRFVLAQLERFAPGIRDRVVAVRGTPASEMAEHNANLVGGDISGGRLNLARLVARPRFAWNTKRLGGLGGASPAAYLCSSATTPGPGVHGLGGLYAAREVLADVFGIDDHVPLGPGQ